VRLLTLTTGGTGKTRLAPPSRPSARRLRMAFGWSTRRWCTTLLVIRSIAQTLGVRSGREPLLTTRRGCCTPVRAARSGQLRQVVGAAPDVASLLDAVPPSKLVCQPNRLARRRAPVPGAAVGRLEAGSLFASAQGAWRGVRSIR
jgi:hypothetical protein